MNREDAKTHDGLKEDHKVPYDLDGDVEEDDRFSEDSDDYFFGG